MSRKRRMFDIDLPAMDDIPVGKVPDKVLEKRRGPMAAAISENADALRDQQSTEETIRAENDRLAHELVRLRSEGLVTERVALADILFEKLTRDRKPGPDPELDELKASIQEIGLSNPIRLERRSDGRFELIQGMRRLSAYRVLYEETGDESYARIPAGISEAGDLDSSYRRMVDENLIRKDISFAEMGALARAYAEDPANDCPDVDKAVSTLFKSASYTKRSYIRSFASLLMMLDKVLKHPNDIPRNVGVELKRKLDATPGLVRQVSAAVMSEPDRDGAREVAILRSFLGAPETSVAKKAPVESADKPRRAKTTFQVSGRAGIAKCSASSGRIELRYDLDFTRVDRSKLEAAIAAFIDALPEEDDLTHG
ncbi:MULTISPECIES: ParB N-terminal domain-containing protein [unclassified Ruegeria]|uniref:ParB/RepB/Spo0J family partition protein n=1 Tax=unclassified Ruegeria TaxID=2625375 RepID=UPI0012695CC7|nr:MULTISPECIES: ParB N-terminal domain-containing protein [unclassified Ruegeria]NOC83031.1 ParB N-terminal domain-containing protein [Ruegeria sp. HKCCD6428]QFT74834.1 ParB-like nuclease domain protein [Ruegeria sp. THAF33]